MFYRYSIYEYVDVTSINMTSHTAQSTSLDGMVDHVIEILRYKDLRLPSYAMIYQHPSLSHIQDTPTLEAMVYLSIEGGSEVQIRDLSYLHERRRRRRPEPPCKPNWQKDGF